MDNKNIHVFSSVDGVVEKLKVLVQEKSNKALNEGGLFKVGLSGGSLVKFLGIILPTLTTDWKKWRFFFCDERHVPFCDDDSTFGLYKKELFDKIPLQEEQFVTINPKLSVDEAAEDYYKKMLEYFSSDVFPQFDLILLGMGPDGHTCSLFPNHKLLKESTKWVASIDDSPKPPSQRITFTIPVLSNAKCCIFAVTGDNKAPAIKDIFENPGNLPASLIKTAELHWILDDGAGKLISKC